MADWKRRWRNRVHIYLFGSLKREARVIENIHGRLPPRAIIKNDLGLPALGPVIESTGSPE